LKRFTLLTGFLLLTTVVVVPFLLLLRKIKEAEPGTDEDIRYDIDDYMAAEGL
jgi:hypothetical protein